MLQLLAQRVGKLTLKNGLRNFCTNSETSITGNKHVAVLLKMLPHSELVLPRDDPWMLSKPFDTSATAIQLNNFSLAVLKDDVDSAWDEFFNSQARPDELLEKVNRDICAKFLALIPSGSVTAKKWWPRANRFAIRMKSAGHSLTSQDYAVLINLAFKARRYPDVERLWSEVETHGIFKSVNLWNQYIQATCDAYSLFWPKAVAPKQWERIQIKELPVKTNNIRELLDRMRSEGLVPDSRTYELVILAMGRCGDLNTAEKIIELAWRRNVLSKDSPLYPTVSTAMAILDAYAMNDEVQKSLNVITQLQKLYNLELNTSNAAKFWMRLLRWIRVKTEPHGSLKTTFFNELWDSMVSVYRFVPESGHWLIYVEHLNQKQYFDELARIIETIHESKSAHSHRVAELALSRAVKGLANTNRALDAVALMEKWALKGLDLRPRLEDYVRQRGATVQLLEVYRDVDDEDSLFGLN